jgi:hypothetical protein
MREREIKINMKILEYESGCLRGRRRGGKETIIIK